jgi:protein SCO1/2
MRLGCFVLLLAALSCDSKSKDLPPLGAVPSFQLQDQESRAFGSAELRGKVWVAAFMFTRCPMICPRITAAMKELQARALAESVTLHWVSFSVDPEHDSPAVLKAYAQEHGAALENWSFLTGPLSTVKTTAEEGFKLGVEGKATDGAEHLGITHGSHLVLVDRTLNIRGYYRTLDDDAQRRLLDDAKQL